MRERPTNSGYKESETLGKSPDETIYSGRRFADANYNRELE